MASVFVSSPAEIVVVDSRTRSGTITLPVTNSIPYRLLSFKDQYGTFSNSTLTISTQLGESFDDGTTSKIFSNAYTYLNLYAVSSKWLVMNATQTQQQTISSLTVNQLTFGTGAGWIQFGPVQASIVSTIQEQTNAAYINNLYIGIQSTVNSAQYNGLFGNYNNTVLAEISTGGGTQEFLVFKGSSSSDRVRVQTTGNFVIETGVSARLFSNTTLPTLSNVTPSFIINTSSNVGIQTATPGATLDVAGTGRFQTLSSQQLFFSSVNGSLPLSVANLTSTTAGITTAYQTAGFISSANLINLVSTTFLNTTLISSVNGLGSIGYISSASLTSSFISTTNFLNQSFSSFSTSLGTAFTSNLLSTVGGLGQIYISTASAGGLTTANLTSTVGGLGSSGYISSLSNVRSVSTQQLFASTSFITYQYSVSSATSSLTIAGLLNMAYNPISNADKLQVTKLYYVNPNSNAGGTYTTYTSGGVAYALHAFTSVGTTTFSNISVIANARVLIVGGGGGGGAWGGGGGGAGGLISLTNQTINTASYSIVVGSGGTGAIASMGSSPYVATNSTNGNNSSAFGQTAVGGGRGGGYQFNAGNGGSGGGGSYSGASGTGTSGQGNNGGSNSIGSGSGGGGAGTAGSNAANDPGAAGNGGDGLANDITGTSLYYAGGGGGATNQVSPATGLGGLGGGGNGANGPDPTNGNNATFYGGGGGGGTRMGAIGGTGYQGVVYISYPLSQYTASGIGINVGSIAGDSNFNLSIEPTSNLYIVGNTQVSGSLTTSTISTGLFNMPYERLGTTSSLTTFQFYGLTGTYTNTVLAELSTGTGTQEFLVFKGSSSSDRVRIQTTGNFVVETGVSARLFSTTTIPTLSNTTPAFIINTSSNVGIQTASPGATLDVAGTGRFQIISSLNINLSSINGQPYTAGGLTTANLTSTVGGLGSIGYISSLSLTSSFISTTNVINQNFSSFSTSLGTAFTSNLLSTVGGLGQIYISTAGGGGGLTTANLTSTVEGLGSIGYISSASLTSSFISTTNFINRSFSSFSSALGPAGVTTANLTSTTQGLGTLGYLSSIPFLLSTAGFFTSSVTASSIVTSSLQVNSLTIGSGTGWLNLGPIQTTIISTLQETTNALYANTAYIGIQSTVNALRYYGLFGNYNNTVLSEISTGAGTQEFLVFKGSSSSDRVRVQTTGNFVIETGVSARLWDPTAITTLSNVTPAFIINTSSNVGIQTASPGATLDVAGTGRFQQVSTLNINLSSINGLSFGGPINSTVIGLGSSGYISSSQLFSTVGGLGSIGYISSASLTSSFISTTNVINQSFSSFSTSLGTAFTSNLLSTVGGLGQIYISTATAGGLTIGNLTSTVEGLGTAGYISSLSLTSSFISTTNFLNQSFSSFSTSLGTAFTSNLLSTVGGLGQIYISTAGGGGGLTTANLTSTVGGLGQIYLSSIPSILSTSAFFTSSAVISTATIGIMSSLITNASTVTANIMTTSTITTNAMTIGTTPTWIFTSPIQNLALSTNTLWADIAYINTNTVTTETVSTLTTNALTLGTGATWIQTAPLQTSIVSSIYMFANQPYFDTVNLGSVSTLNSLQYYGLFGNYNNTVLAEISTGGGTQELLLFKGSSSSDRVRVQTTGTFVIETGVSARLFSTTTIPTQSNATPAFIINSSSNVGIQTASPGATLDVAGTGRFITLSSLALFASSIVAPYVFQPQFFTF
jgi:hypothetical protein